MLAEVAREAQNLLDEQQQQLNRRIVRRQADFFKPVFLRHTGFPPVNVPGHGINNIKREAQGLAHLTHRGAAAVRDDLRRERCSLAAVLGVQILDYLFAALMLKVNINIRRLAALFADEPLEQHADAVGINGGDAQAVAHGGIGRGPAALAENAARACKRHKIMHGKEVVGILQFADELELVLNLRDDLGRHDVSGSQFCIAILATFRNACLRSAPQSVTLNRSLPGELLQVLHRRQARRHYFIRILILDLSERKMLAASRDAGGVRSRPRHMGEQTVQSLSRVQVPLAVWLNRKPRLRQRGAQTDAREHIRQRPPVGLVV